MASGDKGGGLSSPHPVLIKITHETRDATWIQRRSDTVEGLLIIDGTWSMFA